MEVAIHLPDDVAAAMPWEDVPRHILEQIALEGYQERWLSEEQVRRLLGYDTRFEVHGFLKDHGVCLNYADKKNKGLLALPWPHLSNAPGAGKAVQAGGGERYRSALGDSR